MSRWARDGRSIDHTVELMESNAGKAVAVSPNDTTDLVDGSTKGLYVGGTGDIAVLMADGSSILFKGLAGGIVHPLSVKRVKVAGTTATSIVAVY